MRLNVIAGKHNTHCQAHSGSLAYRLPVEVYLSSVDIHSVGINVVSAQQRLVVCGPTLGDGKAHSHIHPFFGDGVRFGERKFEPSGFLGRERHRAHIGHISLHTVDSFEF